MISPALLERARRARELRPQGPWYLEPDEEGNYTLWAGEDEDGAGRQLLGERLDPAFGEAATELFLLITGLLRAIDATVRQRDVALGYLDGDQLAQLAAQALPPPPPHRRPDAHSRS